MNRVPSFLFCVAMAAIDLFCGVNRLQAQDPDSFAHASGRRRLRPRLAAQEPDDEEERNPFAPEPAPALPAGHDRVGYERSARKAGAGHV